MAEIPDELRLPTVVVYPSGNPFGTPNSPSLEDAIAAMFGDDDDLFHPTQGGGAQNDPLGPRFFYENSEGDQVWLTPTTGFFDGFVSIEGENGNTTVVYDPAFDNGLFDQGAEIAIPAGPVELRAGTDIDFTISSWMPLGIDGV
ncbi:MAG: hypothetical protein AAFR74_00440 [Pseudomonadota bacterium]